MALFLRLVTALQAKRDEPGAASLWSCPLDRRSPGALFVLGPATLHYVQSHVLSDTWSRSPEPQNSFLLYARVL